MSQETVSCVFFQQLIQVIKLKQHTLNYIHMSFLDTWIILTYINLLAITLTCRLWREIKGSIMTISEK